MAWIRLDDQIAHHPKLLESGPVCAWFWVCSIGFCQKFLTDGVIPTSAISTLCNVDHPNRCVEKLLAVGLFERHAKGFKIHDYLDFNESAVDVKTRREQDRIRKESARTPHGQTPDNQQIPPASRARDPIPSHPKKISNTNNQLIPKPDDHSTSEHDSAHGNGNGNGNEQPDQAKSFLAWFHQEYKIQRHGADYLVHHKKDEPIVRFLLKHYAVARLQDLAKILLSDKTDDSFIQGTDRGITILKMKANWLNDRLCALEHRNGLH